VRASVAILPALTFVGMLEFDADIDPAPPPPVVEVHIEPELRPAPLSPYEEVIRRHSAAHGIDWKLMTAVAYTESRFDPRARSKVGAMGLFQLMPVTARSLGVDEPDDPEQNTAAAARYLARLKRRFVGKVPEDEQIYFALAAYNAGLGHVWDARALAAQLGLDRNRWSGNVETAMLLLAKDEYAAKARHGFCRGGQSVRYVARIKELLAEYQHSS